MSPLFLRYKIDTNISKYMLTYNICKTQNYVLFTIGLRKRIKCLDLETIYLLK